MSEKKLVTNKEWYDFVKDNSGLSHSDLHAKACKLFTFSYLATSRGLSDLITTTRQMI